jgi:hypothetical protein
MPLVNRCNRSIVFGAKDAGTEAGGGCDTMVVLSTFESRTVIKFVVRICAGTEMNVLVPTGVMTVMSNRPDCVDST